jgi:hypothetical protein
MAPENEMKAWLEAARGSVYSKAVGAFALDEGLFNQILAVPWEAGSFRDHTCYKAEVEGHTYHILEFFHGPDHVVWVSSLLENGSIIHHPFLIEAPR